jgi:hypothetical protein
MLIQADHSRPIAVTQRVPNFKQFLGGLFSVEVGIQQSFFSRSMPSSLEDPENHWSTRLSNPKPPNLPGESYVFSVPKLSHSSAKAIRERAL